ncbi:hypothetical protein L7P61_03465 [Aeromonas veronii bv. sobria]|uniref:TIGR04255 family protein n=1 Tax=Aeromonas veronii TaxID=654 RepID=A0ABY3MN49_AERVE|nr:MULTISPECIES: hypothetical protein [Aeromonas]RDU90722.1 hypothetical protein CGZ76_02280 [Aeromonas veronii]TEY51883.1 hypothetical protein CIG14_10250 [Aeromonas veronii]TEY77541.1 hypothetical protein CIG16_13335 [Aeromonas veronii]TYD45853.1 hypothetical protein CJF24_07625 [Aeromonas veronii]
MRNLEFIFSAFIKEHHNPIDYELMSFELRKILPQINFISPSTYMNIPFDAPPEIPRMQMTRSDGKVKFTFSKNRIDLAFNESFLNESSMDSLSKINPLISSVMQLLMSSLGLHFNRFAIVNRRYDVNPAPEKYLSMKLLKSSENIDSLEVSYSVKEERDGLTLNTSYQFSHGHLNDSRENIYLVTIEVNNEVSSSIDLGNINTIFSTAIEKCERFVF